MRKLTCRSHRAGKCGKGQRQSAFLQSPCTSPLGGLGNGLVRVSSALHPTRAPQKSPREQLCQCNATSPFLRHLVSVHWRQSLVKWAHYSISWPVVKIRGSCGALNRPASFPATSSFLQSLSPPAIDVKNTLNLLCEHLYALFPLPRGPLPAMCNEQTLQS